MSYKIPTTDMKKLNIILAVVLMAVMAACGSKKTEVPSAYAYTTFETTCMGVEHDGSQTLRAWGKGNNKADAIEQAKKNAVYDVLFKGISGNGECARRPLVGEVNARERYANYFNPFFSDGGEYMKFVKEEKSGEKSRIESKASSQTAYGIIVTVDREGLRQQLEKDGVIRPGTTH